MLFVRACVCARVSVRESKRERERGTEEPGHMLSSGQRLPWGLWSRAHPARHFLPLSCHSGPHTFKLTLFCYHKLTQKHNRSIVCWSMFKAAHAIASTSRQSAAGYGRPVSVAADELCRGPFSFSLLQIISGKVYEDNGACICLAAKAKNDMT